ncbi:dTMP kinase [Actinomadura harenae]|uniref:Thymidylate kinase n=2 Tax=Actinomadura harenae TaxID=2483351 RepID=A0A3M2M7C3_9ACTN|nr:dTMP kinase [Actinomadura harenae]
MADLLITSLRPLIWTSVATVLVSFLGVLWGAAASSSARALAWPLTEDAPRKPQAPRGTRTEAGAPPNGTQPHTDDATDAATDRTRSFVSGSAGGAQPHTGGSAGEGQPYAGGAADRTAAYEVVDGRTRVDLPVVTGGSSAARAADAGDAGDVGDTASTDHAARRMARAVFGVAPVAALVFVLTSLLADKLLNSDDRVHLALYVAAVVFALSAIVTSVVGGLPGADGPVPDAPVALFRRLGPSGIRGLRFAVAASALPVGALLAVARVHTGALHGGDPGYGMILCTLAAGLACGLVAGPRVLRPFSRRRLLGLSSIASALLLAVIAVGLNLVVVVFVAGFLGVAAGMAWASAEAVVTDNPLRVRTGTVLTLVVAAIAAPLAAGAIGGRHVGRDFPGSSAALLITAVIALVAGLIAYRLLDERTGIPLVPDLAAALRGEVYVPPSAAPAAAPRRTRERGVFIVFEGGEGAGKTTQSRLAAIWLREHGYEVVTTREPGATKTGMRLRALLLDRETTGLSSRAETLLYAADRADHVANVIQPALERGAIVVSDRFVDSTLAYQGFGRQQPVEEIAAVNAWGTGGLVPDLTVLLELPPEKGLNRLSSPADRIESEPREFHERVLSGFRALAEAEPDRYLVLDASRPEAEIRREVRDRIRDILPDPVPASTEDATSTFPAITD